MFWIIVAVFVIIFFPTVAVGAVVTLVLFVAVLLLAVLLDGRDTMRKAAKGRKQSEAQRCEREAAERARLKEWGQAAAEQRERQKEEGAAKARTAEKAHRAQAERIAEYNRLAKESAEAGDLEDAKCWRRLAVEELEKYTKQNRF